MSLVREFHEETGQEVADRPTPPDTWLARYRGRLITEEFKEVMAEIEKLAARCHTTADKLDALAALLKELCDLQYVIEGTAVSLGLPLEDAYRAVHASNMSKRFPDGTFHVNEHGKVIKGPDYEPPNMREFVPPVIDAEYKESPDD